MEMAGLPELTVKAHFILLLIQDNCAISMLGSVVLNLWVGTPRGGCHMIMGGSPDDSEVIYLRTC